MILYAALAVSKDVINWQSRDHLPDHIYVLRLARSRRRIRFGGPKALDTGWFLLMMPASVLSMVSVGELSPVLLEGLAIAARPKSSTLTSPAGVTMMFAAFKSRWVTAFFVGGFERVGYLQS